MKSVEKLLHEWKNVTNRQTTLVYN